MLFGPFKAATCVKCPVFIMLVRQQAIMNLSKLGGGIIKLTFARTILCMLLRYYDNNQKLSDV